MSEKWSKEFDSCFQVGSIEEIADALEKRSGSEENALAMLAMTAFTLMTRRGICEMQNVAPDGKGIRLELIGFRGNETIPDMNRPGFPGECFICELRLPDHRFRWKHNKLFLLLPEEYGPAFPAIVDCYTSPPT